jgi:putative transposase
MGERRTHEVKRRRHTPEQIVRKLREADRMLAAGAELPEAAKALEVSEATYHRWRAQYG